MRREFMVPDVGEGLTEVVLVEWLVAAGDDVELNQALCTIETEKATIDLPSPYAGTVLETVGVARDVLAVGSLLLAVDDIAEVEVDAEVDDEVEVRADGDAATREPTLVGYGAGIGSSRTVRRRDWSRTPDGNPPPPPIAVAVATAPAPPALVKPRAKPPVRKLARDRSIDLTTITGTGTDGVITRADVLAASGPAVTSAIPEALDGDTIIPVTGVRARIAERMTQSRTEIPDASCGLWVDATRLLSLRDELRTATADGDDASVLTPFALVLRFVVIALGREPMLNATFDAAAAEIRVHPAIHLGVATTTDAGLLVPVIRDAQTRTTLDIARELRRVSEGARARTLTPPELRGSTFTVTNFGALGLDDGYPVINHPEAAILGVGSIKPRPVVVGDEIVARPTMKLICAFDHRVCDGAEAGRLLTALRDLIEHPTTALLAL